MGAGDWWFDNGVLHEMVSFMENREGYMHITDGYAPTRKLCVRGTNNLAWAIKRLKRNGFGLKICVGSNILDWDKLKSLPLMEMFKQQEYKVNVWNPVIGNPEVYLGKNLIWDIDNTEGKPMAAFYQGEKVCAFLTRQGYDPMLVFSGGKGFHVWLNNEDTKKMAGTTFKDFEGDRAQKLAKVYCEVVKEVFLESTGVEFRGDDLTPVERQGIIACPYSIHWTTGQIVWPLDEGDLNALRMLDADALPIDIAKALHTQENGQLWKTDLDYTDNPLFYPPCHTVGPKSGDVAHRRGLPLWKGIDG